MSFATPTRSSSSLDRLLRHGSGSHSHSHSIYSKSPTKPKRLQSAHLDEATGLWRCKNCGYNYPNPEPHHHQRRAHKKICEGELKVQRWLSGSGTEETGDSRDTSNVVDKAITPETADTATSALAIGNQHKHDGADIVRDSDLTDTGDGNRVLDWEQLLDRESKAHGTPSGNDSGMESKIRQWGDAKGEAHGEPMLSTQSGIVGSGEKSDLQRNEQLESGYVHGKDFQPLIDDPGRMQGLHEGESSASHEPSQYGTDKVDFSFFPSSEFEDVSKDNDSVNKEGREMDTGPAPLWLPSANEADSLKDRENALEHGEKGDPGLLVESGSTLMERTEVVEGNEPGPMSHEAIREDQADLGEASDQREPTPAADVRSETEEVLQQSEDGERNFRENQATKEKRELLQEVEENQLTVSGDGNAQKVNAETGEGSNDKLTAADESVLTEKEEAVGTEQGITTNDQDVKVDVSHGGLSSAAADGTQNEKGDERQNFQFARDEGAQNATSQGQSDRLEPTSEAEGVQETADSSRGSVRLSAAERNWDDWEHVVSGEDMLGEARGTPMLQEIGEAGLLLTGDGLTSNDQSNNLENESANKSASTLAEAGGVLKSDQSAGKEIGFQPAGVDWILGLPDTSKETVDKKLLDYQSSSSADYLSTADHEETELIPGLNEAGDSSVDVVATLTPASQHQADQPNKVVVRLSPAETNWEDWEDVIKTGPMLVQGITLEKAEDPESSGEYQTPRVESLEGGDVSGSDQGKTGTVLESACVEGAIDTASAGLPVPIPESDNSDWLIDFSEPSMKNNEGTANETTAGPAASSEKLEVPETKFFDLLELNESSSQGQGASLLDTTPVTSQSETGQIVLSKFSSALRNWEDWEDVVRESERVSGLENSSALLESDLLGIGEHQTGLESPNRADTNIVEIGSSKPAGLVDGLKSPPVVTYVSAAINSGQETEGVNQEVDGVATLWVPLPNVASSGFAENREFLDSDLGPTEGGVAGRTNGGMEVGSTEDTSRLESRPADAGTLSSAQEDWDDWEDVRKSEYFPVESRQSSPSFEDAHDGELSSEHDYLDGRRADVNLAEGKRRLAEWEDLTKSEYMQLDGPGGEKLTFKRISDLKEPLSSKFLGRKISPSFDELDDDGSASLSRNGRPQPEDTRSLSFRPLRSASPRGVVKSDYPAGSNSFPVIETTPRSLPASSPRKADFGDMADREPLVTRRPLIYRGSRRDYASEVEDMEDVTSEPQNQHRHDHNQLQQEEAFKYDVEKILKGQTKYELICPICGALITRKIILRKKKGRFPSEGDPRWGRSAEISPAEIAPAATDNGNQTPRSDTSSEMEDASSNWNKGIRPCLGYFFGE